MTLAEHDAKPKAEGKWDEFVAQKRERDKQCGEYARAEAPLVHALNVAGVPASSVWNLVNAAGQEETLSALQNLY